MQTSRSVSSLGAFRFSRSQCAPTKRTIRFFRTQPSPDEYLHDTIVPTFHFQKSLLRLPIPKLEDTLHRYLCAIEPVVTPSQLQHTQRAVQEFKEGIGPQLQESLIARDAANTHTSYINQWWLELYLQDRRPLVVNYNPQMTLLEDPTPLKNSWTQRATSLITSSIRFYRTLDTERLKPDLFHTKAHLTKRPAFDYYCKLIPERWAMYGAAAWGAYPLDMSQYQNLFASVRIPQDGESDRLKTFSDSRHIVVQRNAEFYRVQVLDETTGSFVGQEAILAQLKQIVAHPADEVAKEGAGLFTTLDRDHWARVRREFAQLSSMNQTFLQTIDSALFVVTLDDHAPRSEADMSRTFLLGNGSNHWFDKSFQLIVASNGKAAVNFEHSWGDGVAVLRYVNELYEDSIKHSVVVDKNANALTRNVEPLEYDLNLKLREDLKKAKAQFQQCDAKLQVESVFSPITKKQISQFQIGTDGVMQMAIQLAHFRLHQKFVSTYESASTAAYKHGRTETLRSCTNEAVDFVKKMVDGELSAQEKHQALRVAVNRHGELTKDAVMGQGHDRHLFALRKMAELRDIPLPELFTLASAEIMNKIILSTSTLSSPNIESGSFGPVNDECYGIGYGIEAPGAKFQLSSYRDDASQLAELLAQSLTDIKDLLASQSKLN
uniref:Choline/Carnitine Oacyltransferase putative n=1 Tax=Albugo laibachii Nc14 TaxID=890382 RepID=F0X1Y1_9STRA|nr:choline/Carnitine Oacyltransferase putative [Albugo laibachii Nc14]|eukprot:CCA27840.1 choline/Carnitine Oacyltransferase putative [Albugo laibachii Nc14]